MKKKLTLVWFFIGLGMQLQIAASLSITELVVLVSSPFIFVNDYSNLKRDGLLPFLYLSILVIIGCIIACVANHTHAAFAFRGLAVCGIVSASIVFSHWIIRRDPAGFKWMVLGIAISLIVCIFVFRRSVEVSMYGDDAQSIMEGQLFLVQRISPWVLLPTRGWYIHQLQIVNTCAPLVSAAIALLYSSGSGRSAALSSIAFSALTIIGGRKRSTMLRISRYFWVIIVLTAMAALAMNAIYRMSATQGWLGEKARAKYEAQTHGEKGIVRLLLGGRADAFIGLLACRDKPIVGWGPWAEDTQNYRGEFMSKYGTIEDFEFQLRLEEGRYYEHRQNLISCHSHITEFWLWYGISGLIFIVYVMYVLVRFLQQDVAIVPQWFGWLACAIPGMMWHIFFSPFANRVELPMMVVACLMARAIRKGRFRLPHEMVVEIEKAEKK